MQSAIASYKISANLTPRGAKMRVRILAIALVSLAGCAGTTVNEMRAPDGTSMKNVKCNMDSQKCFAQASESCKDNGGTYRVVSSHSNAGGTLADIIPGPVTWYNMTYVCGPSDGKMPEFPFKGQQYAPPPVIVNQPQQQIRSRPSTTNCTRIGDSVNCTTY